MISNRDKNTNLANEIEKKKRQLQEQNITEQKKMRIAYIAIGSLTVIMIGLGLYNYSHSEQAKKDDFVTPQTDSEAYNSKLEAIQAKKEHNPNPNLLDIFSQKKKDTVNQISIEEQKLKQKLDSLAENQKTVVKTKKNKKQKSNVYGDYSMWEKKESPSSEEKTNNKPLEIKETTIEVQEKPLTKEEEFAVYMENYYKHKEQEVVKIKTVQGTIDYTQKVMNGSSVRLRLLEDLIIDGVRIPEDKSIYGNCIFKKNGRVIVNVTSISHNNKIYDTNLSVYDYRDGQQGLVVGVENIKAALDEETKKEASRTVNSQGGKIGSLISKVFDKARRKNTKIELYHGHRFYIKPLQ